MRSLGRVTDLLELTARLVDIPSESHDEAAITSWLEAELRRDAPWLVIERIGLNLVARTELGRTHRLLLAGHTDTVPVNGNVPARRRRRHAVGAAARAT